MFPKYETYIPEGRNLVIKRTDADGAIWWIPSHESNSDYQAYLAWVAEGNTAEEWSPEA